MSKIIVGVQLQNRMKDAANFQSLVSKYGSSISSRMGLHFSASDDSLGLIILEFSENADKQVEAFEKEIAVLEDVKVRKMVF